jgi:hypothetical protein
MNLVCFSSLTAGALVCNLLNNKFTEINAPDVISKEHSFFKIGDSWGKTHREYNDTRWKTKLMMAKFNFTTEWLGTHCHPSVIECLSTFEKKIAITTTTELSKYYRFLRAYHLFFNKDKSHLNGIIDAIRDDFEPHNDCTNIEFSDIIDGTFVKNYNLNIDYFDAWKTYNSFLYKQDPFLLEYFNKGIKNAI